ncbi:hypothetical protein C8E00_104308 [Chromohalobacter marismortui]|uniref:DUF1453 domain-containing protein n=1 Tax=Chromohalobacter marismortui TaxID=42055 RepID=A0A4R7NN89_9GAMM|nr:MULTISPECIES: hypothetical protein [Chromohalobacter]MCI0509973.1 hypothetical protein [Chromohalobacter sp.]MCI0593095.1 hypothetical protein [Chromohalobacter sp.]TDU22128.1 hypothetical protein C8E00_104308 [Chromohalobacter marismortui]
MSTIIVTVTHTPLWVWPLLVFLIVRGLQMTRRREVTTRSLWLPPLIGIVLAVHRLSPDVPTTMIGLLTGIALGSLAVAILRPARHTRRLANGRLELAGDWMSLLLFMVLFGVNYAHGVLEAMAPSLVTTWPVSLGVSLTTGFVMTYLILRSLCHWAVARRYYRTARPPQTARTSPQGRS